MNARTFASAKEALGVARATVLVRGGIRQMSPVHGGPAPDEWTAVVVLQAMREAGAPHDSDAGRALLAWASAPDDVGLEVDSQLRTVLSVLLEQAGLVRRPLRIIPLGWRVHARPDGSKLVTCVADPDPRDTTIVRGSRATAIAAALAGGLVVELLPAAANVAPLDTVRAEALAAIEAGEPLRRVDALVASRLQCSERTARSIRLGWRDEAEQAEASEPAALGC